MEWGKFKLIDKHTTTISEKNWDFFKKVLINTLLKMLKHELGDLNKMFLSIGKSISLILPKTDKTPI